MRSTQQKTTEGWDSGWIGLVGYNEGEENVVDDCDVYEYLNGNLTFSSI